MIKYILMLLLAVMLVPHEALGQDRWKAPAEADTLENPYDLDDAEVIAEGKEVYFNWCSTCHGERGDGAGEAGQHFEPPPADFTSEEVQQQSDGALFWKVMEGNPPNMISYKEVLSEAEVWKVVSYLRQFDKEQEE